MDIKVVIGAGYGDEGKGLMTDYFCRTMQDNNVLNIKVNGGAQAGHTVCALDDGEYKHWVFRQYGSGTFAKADTYIAETFMFNIDEFIKEREALKSIYNIQNRVYISRDCRITLPIHILVNRLIEDNRTKKHGSCGLGIYETFHMNKDFESIKFRDIIKKFCNSIIDTEKYINDLSYKYLEFRCEEINNTEEFSISSIDRQQVLEECYKLNKIFIENLADLAKFEDISLVNNIDELSNMYNIYIFECSQGLELDQYESRNWPHLTPSSTGIENVCHILNKSNKLKNIDVEACFVTRTYKTKHGAGPFVEEDTEIQNQYGLYDRTNQPNQYQGTLKYGTLNIGRLKRIIMKQIMCANEKSEFNMIISLAVTHLDQTNGGILTNLGRIAIQDMLNSIRCINGKIYKSYGEKATDIII
ncbi:MAG: adenylosuccinate synthetase [Lachnospiraceae bacterium]|nr:adenylosuccinate synthetase [Lachnospiraceae bacterium]